MDNVKYSIIIPVYNSEKYLEECIDSVINQNRFDYEIILINDGSTDNSGLICDKYAERYNHIRVIHQSNQGQNKARFKGINISNGKYCIFLDSDDYWDKTLLEEIDLVLNKEEYDVVIFNMNRISKNNIRTENSIFEDLSVFCEDSKDIVFKKLISTSCLNSLFNKVIKRDIISEYDKFNKIRLITSEDLLVSLSILYTAHNIIYLDKPLYNYRMNENSVTHKFNSKKFDDITIVRYEVLEYLKKLNMHNKENLSLFYKFYINQIILNIISLINSDINSNEKKEWFNYARNLELVKYAENYIDMKELPYIKKIRYTMFFKGHFKLLTIIEKMVLIVKKYLREI